MTPWSGEVPAYPSEVIYRVFRHDIEPDQPSCINCYPLKSGWCGNPGVYRSRTDQASLITVLFPARDTRYTPIRTSLLPPFG